MEQARKITDCYIAALLSLFLLGVSSAGYGAITAYKFRLLAVLTLVWLGALAVCRIRYRLPVPRPDLWDGLILGYGGLSLLSALVNQAPLLGGSRREGAVSILLYCLMVLGLRRFGRAKPWMLHLLGGSMTVWCLIALLQLAGYNPLTLYPAGMAWQDRGVLYSGAYIGTTGNTDLAGALLCLCIPALAGGLLRLRDRRRFWLALPLVLCLYVLSRMEVRGALLGLLAGGLFALPLLLPVSGKTRKRLLAGACALAVAAVLLICLVRLPGTLGEAYDLIHGQTDLYTGAGRVYIWQRCLALLAEKPLLGCGPDMLGSTGLYFERYDPAQNVIYRSVIDTAHNEYLNAAVQQGIPAALCFLGALALPFFRRSSTTHSRICRGALLCWAVQACFSFSMVITAPYFWLTLAIAAREAP